MEAIENQFEEYEQLAYDFSFTNDGVRAFSSQPFSASASKIVFDGCNTEISGGEYILGFNCIGCHVGRRVYKQQFNDNELYETEDEPVSKMEYPKCYVCNEFIQRNAYKHTFWPQLFCHFHAFDGTSKCISCGRFETKGIKHILIEKGRKLCPECSSFKIMDTNECQPLFHEIQEFYASLDMKLDQKIPLWLVESQALNDPKEGEENGRHNLCTTHGICLSEPQDIPIVRMMKRLGGYSMLDMLEPYPELVINHAVHAILVLYGFPRLLTGANLAHEMMHAWLKLQGYPILEQKIVEGMCEILGHMWLKSKINQLGEIEKELGKCFIVKIETDTSMYGEGFRMAEKAVSQYGLKKTLDHIKLHRTFPSM